MGVPASLAEMLRCPVCKSEVAISEMRIDCLNGECRRSYPIREGIPVMLADEATILDMPEWQAIADSRKTQ